MSEETQEESALFELPKGMTNHDYTHRMMRLLGLVHVLPVKEGYPQSEFLIRSCMMSNILVMNMHDKLEIEAGTLSFIPQYCEMKKKSKAAFIRTAILENFGKDVLTLVMEVEEMRQSFINDEAVDGFSRHAKELYGVQIYLDLVNMLNPNVTHKVIDGVLYEIRIADKVLYDVYQDNGKERRITIEKGEEWIEHEGLTMSMSRFYTFMTAMARWKLDQMRYVRVGIQQSIAELSHQIAKQKGVIV